MRVVVTGGGTAGHAYPGAAVADVLHQRGTEIVVIGTAVGPEARLVSERGFPFERIEILGRERGTFNLHNLKAAGMLARGTARSVFLLGVIEPDVVFSTGGYVSLPVALAAAIHRIPIVVHEQNTKPGLANRIAARFAAAVGISFAGSESNFRARVVLTGNPVRSRVASVDKTADRDEGLDAFELAPGRRTLLIAGGSQGARSINEAMLGAYEQWRDRDLVQVLHLVGPKNIDSAQHRMEEMRGADDRIIWRLVPFTDRIHLAYAVADLAVCRAGATTIAELAATGVPAILVPFPYALDEDQLHNGEAAAASGGAEVIPDSEIQTPGSLARIEALLFDKTRLAEMSQAVRRLHIADAAERLADLVEQAATGSRPQDPAHSSAAAVTAAGPPLRAVSDARLGLPWRRVHMVGVGGAGMSAIARILIQAGIEVTGSDLSDSRTIDALRALGMRVQVGHSPEQVGNSEVVIYSSAVPPENVELSRARSMGCEILSRGEALARIVSGYRVIAVSGTHGKTTTSGMIATILELAGLDPTYLMGGDLSHLGPGGKLGSGKIAVVESDEAYGSFLALTPEIALVTNVDSDHLDFYGSMEAIQQSFERFVGGAGEVIICFDDERAASIAHPSRTTYGLSEAADVSATDVILEAGSSRFVLQQNQRPLGRVLLKVGGRRNVQNAIGAAAAGLMLGLEPKAVIDGLGGFRGVSRRFQYRGTFAGADIIDDYGHHPTEIEATLSDARSGPWPRIVAVFQPHLYSRTRTLHREFGAALGQADLVVVTDVYGAREDPLPGVTGKLIAEAACEASPATRVAYFPKLDEAAEFVRRQIRPGDLVLSLGAGDITTFPDRLLSGAR